MSKQFIPASTGLLMGVLLSSPSFADNQTLSLQELSSTSIKHIPLSPAKANSAPKLKSTYLLRFKDAPLASYSGGIDQLQATSPEITAKTKLDSTSSAAVAYKTHLQGKHEALKTDMENLIGRPIVSGKEYFYAINGMTIELTEKEAAKLKQLVDIAYIQPDTERKLNTDAGPAWIGATDVWAGATLTASKGEGIIIGIIDTGINPSNPSFADIGPIDAYDHTNPKGTGVYVGVCDTGNANYDATFPCNDKLIGAWGYAGDPNDTNGIDPRDWHGHGSHTASTAAGNAVDLTDYPSVGQTTSISGVAPHANIIAYAACCKLSNLVAAIDQAVADGVDVINYSIGSSGAADVWNDADTIAFRNARAAGIFVATSAGNDGPASSIPGSPAEAPWLTSVGAVSHDRVFESTLSNMTDNGDGITPPTVLKGQGITNALASSPIVHARDFDGIAPGDPGDGECLQAFSPSTWTTEIVVCDAGDISTSTQASNVSAGGAAAIVVANTAAQGEYINIETSSIPMVHLGATAATSLSNWMAAGTGHAAAITASNRVVAASNADIIASFSSRFTGRTVASVIKPDLVAPGVNILAATGINDPATAVWSTLSGTSMSSAHVAGAAALIQALHPSWTPAEIQSALQSTAVSASLKKADGATPADPFDRGSGIIDLGAAAADNVGLLLNETDANYTAANPATGGDPRTLNLASMADNLCLDSCSWTRTVRNASGMIAGWDIVLDNPPGWELSASPTSFALLVDEVKPITITAKRTATTLPDGSFKFGAVHLNQSGGSKNHTLPVAVAFAPPAEPIGSYTQTTSTINANCKATSLANSGAYLDLEAFGKNPDPAVSGDNMLWSFSNGRSYNFFGIEYSELTVSDNGFLVFDPASAIEVSNTATKTLPSLLYPNGLIAALWADHEVVYNATPPNKGITVASLMSGTTPVATIIEYDDVEPQGGGTSVGDFEIVVYNQVDDGTDKFEIVVAYDNLNNLPALATIGVENQDGSAGSAFLNNANPSGQISDGFAVCYDYQRATCKDYWVLNKSSQSAIGTYDARLQILAGDQFFVDLAESLVLNTKAGGSVRFYPGFGVATGGSLSVNTNNAAVCP